MVRVLLVGMLLVGCALPPPPPNAAYLAALKSWEGRDVNVLIQTLGPPSSVYRMPNGSTMFTWAAAGPETRTGFYYGGIMTTTTRQLHCSTTFTVAPDGLVAAISHAGNACQMVPAPSAQPVAQGGPSQGVRP